MREREREKERERDCCKKYMYVKIFFQGDG
jgi:hypothetical protein